VAIGSTTAETLAEMGLKADVMPEKHLFEEALNALGKYWDMNDRICCNSRGGKET